MSETVSTKQPAVASRRWLDITRRVLAGVVIFLAVVGLLVDMGVLAGNWIVRAPAISNVTAVAAIVTRALGTADNGLARVNTLVQDAQQTVTQVNNEAARLGDRVRANSPVVDRLVQLVENDLAPRIENVRTNASAIHDAVLVVGSAATLLNRVPGIQMPSLGAELGAVSDRAQEAQAAVQDLRVTLAGMKAGLVTKAEAAVTQVTSRINTSLARMQALVHKYQAKVTQVQAWVTSTSNTIILLINIQAVCWTILSLVVAAALVLLIYVCWKYVRSGRFPSLRVVRAS